MFSTTITGTVYGVQAYLVRVEADVSNGLPAFLMVGSLSLETRESRERVMVALKNVGLQLPAKHITINLSPGDRRKEGTAFDLPIAVAVLRSMEMLPQFAEDEILFLGELGLNGEMKKAKGVLPIIMEAARMGVKQCIVPLENVEEAAVIPDITIRGAENILQVISFLTAGEQEGEAILPAAFVCGQEEPLEGTGEDAPNFSKVIGQETAKRGAEIAAAGFHNLLMTGPPGVGKSMIAKCILDILPPLTLEESLEVTTIKSISGEMSPGEALVSMRPFQSPHHSISTTAMVGGGRLPKPGVISMAHRGVLFLDELPEFDRKVLDSLRQPMEDRQLHVSRLQGNVTFPADFMLIAAMNPCLCGYYPDKSKCRCTELMVKKYLNKVSGPILDRMDLCVELQAVSFDKVTNNVPAEDSDTIRLRVKRAREAQEQRFAHTNLRFNGDIPAASIEKYCPLDKEQQRIMEQLYQNLQLSVRAYHKILRVARTISDLSGEEKILSEHLMEAAMYRPSVEYWK